MNMSVDWAELIASRDTEPWTLHVVVVEDGPSSSSSQQSPYKSIRQQSKDANEDVKHDITGVRYMKDELLLPLARSWGYRGLSTDFVPLMDYIHAVDTYKLLSSNAVPMKVPVLEAFRPRQPYTSEEVYETARRYNTYALNMYITGKYERVCIVSGYNYKEYQYYYKKTLYAKMTGAVCSDTQCLPPRKIHRDVILLRCNNSLQEIPKNTTKSVETCLANPFTRFLILNVTIMSTEMERRHASGPPLAQADPSEFVKTRDGDKMNDDGNEDEDDDDELSCQSNHACVMIYDKVHKTLELFNPTGAVAVMSKRKERNARAAVRYIASTLMHMPSENFDSHIFLPDDFQNLVGLQSLENDEMEELQKRGTYDPSYPDIGGFCVAWTYFYIEARLSNPDLHPADLHRLLIARINQQGSFLDFIVKYATHLTRVIQVFNDQVMEPEESESETSISSGEASQ